MEEIKKVIDEITRSIQRMAEDLKREYRLYEEGDEIRLEIDMPGLEVQDISLSVTKDGTAIRAEGARGDRRYSRYIRLPYKIDPSSINAVYRNGVLQIVARKVKEEEIRVPVRG